MADFYLETFAGRLLRNPSFVFDPVTKNTNTYFMFYQIPKEEDYGFIVSAKIFSLNGDVCVILYSKKIYGNSEMEILSNMYDIRDNDFPLNQNRYTEIDEIIVEKSWLDYVKELNKN